MIKVTSYDRQQKIITVDIEGQPLTQATVPEGIFTKVQAMEFLQNIVRPVIDSLIQQSIYDLNLLVQDGDLSSTLLTPEQILALNILFSSK